MSTLSENLAERALRTLARTTKIDPLELARMVLIAHLLELGERWPSEAPASLALDLALEEDAAALHVRAIVARIQSAGGAS